MTYLLRQLLTTLPQQLRVRATGKKKEMPPSAPSFEGVLLLKTYCGTEEEPLEEVALLLGDKSPSGQLKEERQRSYKVPLPLWRRLALKVSALFWQILPTPLSHPIHSPEIYLKTTLSTLLDTEWSRELLLGTAQRRQAFLTAISHVAQTIGYTSFVSPTEQESEEICRSLTWLTETESSLLEDPVEYTRLLQATPASQRETILFSLFHALSRPPILSTLSWNGKTHHPSLSFKTEYARYHILSPDPLSGTITYTLEGEVNTASIQTRESLLDHFGVTAQRRCYTLPGTSTEERAPLDAYTLSLGSYCGELCSPRHLLEQILFLLNCQEPVTLIPSLEAPNSCEEVKIAFTSLFPWMALGKILEQKEAIRSWNRACLKIGERYIRLNLLYLNIPCEKHLYPTPEATVARLRDIQDLGYLMLTEATMQAVNYKDKESEALLYAIEQLDSNPTADFFQKEQLLCDVLDQFRGLSSTFLHRLPDHPLVSLLRLLLSGKTAQGEKIQAGDLLLYVDQLVRGLGYLHNKNYASSLEEEFSPPSLDKAAWVFTHWLGHPFLPGQASQEEETLFRTLYHLYYHWEESPIQMRLTTA